MILNTECRPIEAESLRTTMRSYCAAYYAFDTKDAKNHKQAFDTGISLSESQVF